METTILYTGIHGKNRGSHQENVGSLLEDNGGVISLERLPSILWWSYQILDT